MTRHRRFVAVVIVATAAVLAAEVGDAWARARGGGSRGSRTWSAPARPSPTPASPAAPSSSRSVNQPSPAAPGVAPQPSFFSRFGGMLTGLALGGLLGSLLFGGHGLGVGLLEMLLLGGIAFMAWQLLRRRRETAEPAYARAGVAGPGDPGHRGGVATFDPPGAAPATATLDDRLGHGRPGHGRSLDPAVDLAAFADRSRAFFEEVQRAVGMRDVDRLRDRLTPEMMNVLRGQVEELRRARRTSAVEEIEIDHAEVTESWDEAEHEFLTVYLAGSFLEYTTDDRTGLILEGSRTERQRFEEFWTFTRPAGGSRPWKLGAIQPA